MEKKRTSESEEDTSMSSILQNTKYNLSEDQVDDILKLLKENFVVERKSNLKRHSFAQWIYFVTSLVLTIGMLYYFYVCFLSNQICSVTPILYLWPL